MHNTHHHHHQQAPASAKRGRTGERELAARPMLKTERQGIQTMTHIQLPVGALADALARCKPSMSNEETRYYLNGVNLRHDRDGAILQSTDGHRLTRIKIAGEIPPFGDIILSRQCVADIQKAVKRRHHHSVATIALGENVIAIPGLDNIPLARVEGTFPDCDRVIPKLDGTTTATLDRKEFLKAVAAVHGFAAGAGHDCLRLSFKADKLVLSAATDGGSARFELDCDRGDTASDMDIGFNGQYLADFAKRIDSGKIAIHLSDAGSPTRFSGVDSTDAHETFVLMPMRV